MPGSDLADATTQVDRGHIVHDRVRVLSEPIGTVRWKSVDDVDVLGVASGRSVETASVPHQRTGLRVGRDRVWQRRAHTRICTRGLGAAGTPHAKHTP